MAMKIDRLLSILLLLMKREKVTASELAAYFETSLRTIYRDMDTLCLAGIPICSEQGSGGGYSLMPGFTLDRQVLKVDELLTLMAGLKGLQGISDDPAIRQAYEKVQAVAPAGKETLEIDFFGWDQDNRIQRRVGLLRKAITQLQLVGFEYTNLQNQCIERVVEPHKLFFRGSHWYLLGWCRVRQDFRFFRISRMEKLALQTKTFTFREYGDSDWEPDRKVREGENIHINVSKEGALKAREFFSDQHMEELPDGSLDINVPFPADEWLYSYLLGYGASLKVLHPPELKEELLHRAKHFIKNNQT